MVEMAECVIIARRCTGAEFVTAKIVLFFLIQILKVEGFFFYLCANRAVKVSTSNYKTVSVWREGMFSERLFLLGNRDCLCTGV